MDFESAFPDPAWPFYNTANRHRILTINDLITHIIRLFHPTLNRSMLFTRPDPFLYCELQSYFRSFTEESLRLVAEALEQCEPFPMLVGAGAGRKWAEVRMKGQVTHVSLAWLGWWIEQVRIGKEWEFRVFEEDEDDEDEDEELKDEGYEAEDENEAGGADDNEEEDEDEDEDQTGDDEDEDAEADDNGEDNEEDKENDNEDEEEESERDWEECFQCRYELMAIRHTRQVELEGARRLRIMAQLERLD